MKVHLEVIKFEKPDEVNVIIGQSHFIKTIEDIYEVLVSSVPLIKFGLAFNEASGECLTRSEATNDEMRKIAVDNAVRIGCGHMFIVALKDTFAINVLNQIKGVSEVCRIFCATANPLEVIVAQTDQGKAILGVVDGLTPKGIENSKDREKRKELLRKFGYKL